MVDLSREALVELAERVEKAEGAEESLHAEVALAAGWQHRSGKGWNMILPWERPNYTGSIDAAMSLASDRLLRKFGGPSAMLREAMDRLAKQFALHIQLWPDNEDYAQWLARFVTAAALRARSAVEQVPA